MWYSIHATDGERKDVTLLVSELEAVMSETLVELYRNGGHYFADDKILEVTHIRLGGVDISWDQFTAIIALRDISLEGL